MSSGRPKSLEELNNMYNKKIAAESAMKKVSSRLDIPPEPTDTKPPVYEPYTFDDSKFKKEKTEPVNDITGAVNDFIKNFGQTEEKKPVKVQNVHPVQTKVKSTKIPSKPTGKAVNPQKKKPVPAKKQERNVLAISSERNDLMDDYMKIMSDMEEESLSIKERLALKKKDKSEKKENHKSSKKEHKKLKHDSEQPEVMPDVQPEFDDSAEDTAIDYLQTEQVSFDKHEPDFDVADSANDDDISYIPEHGYDTPYDAQVSEDDVQMQQSEQSAQHYDPMQVVAEDIPVQWNTDENEQDYEQPDAADEAEQYDEQTEQFESFIGTPAKKRKGGAARAFSLILLILMLIITACVGALKYVVNVDTGKPFLNKYYVFTAEQRLLYSGTDIGDLVISEDRTIATEDAFVYYDNTSFRFAKPSDIVPSNEYAIIAENDNEQVIASTSNTRGVIIASIPYAGKVVNLITDNFIIAFAASAGCCLLLIIITAVLFAKAKKREDEFEYSLDDDYDEDYSDYGEEEYEPESEQVFEENSEEQPDDSQSYNSESEQAFDDVPYDDDVQPYDLADEDFSESFEQADTDE